jgi:hypothetical protein
MTTVEHDLLLIKREFAHRGWAKGSLLDLKTDDPNEWESCGVCMTAAVGLVTEGLGFINWAAENACEVPADWEWSARGLAVFTALWEHRPKVKDIRYDPDLGIVGLIVDINDSHEFTQVDALAWIDHTIAGERGEQDAEQHGLPAVVS